MSPTDAPPWVLALVVAISDYEDTHDQWDQPEGGA